MYLNRNNVGGETGRRCNGNVAGETGRRCNGNVGGETGRRNCDFVFECLLDLIEDALGEDNHCWNKPGSVSPGGGSENNRRCRFVFECLADLLEDALEEDNCHCKCRRPR